MKKKTTLILQKNYLNLGKKGEIIKVNPGYAFNYLIPNSIAKHVTKGTLKHYQMFSELDSKQKEQETNKAKQIYVYLQRINKIKLYKKSGDKLHIFGSITDKDIINQLDKIIGIKLTKKQLNIPQINQIGLFNIQINLIKDLSYNMKFHIIPIDL